MLKLGLENEAKIKISKKFFEKISVKFEEVLEKRIKKFLRKRKGGVDLVLVKDKSIKEINREYRGKDEPTDVISFAYLEVTEFEKEKGDIIVGDIFISVDTAKRQAKEKGHSVEREIEILFVHGLLHLFGFDHKTRKQEAEMEKWAGKVVGNTAVR